MKCNDAKQYLLLDQSGELDQALKADLDGHLKACADCSGYAVESMKLADAVSAGLKDGKPNQGTIDNIMSFAREQGRPRQVVMLPGYRKILAYAAAVLFVLGGTLMYMGGPAVESTSTADLGALVAALSEDDTAEQYYASESEDEKLRALAHQLLELQGFGSDDYDAEEEAILLGEPLSTDLQSQSSGVSLRGARV